MAEFKPKSVFTIYTSAPPAKVWQALTSPDFTRYYFFGRAIELEPRVGGGFCMRLPDGRIDVQGHVIAWDPPHQLVLTWRVESHEDMRKLPECLVTYDIATAGAATRLTVTESYSWEVPDALLEGGRTGWPAVLSGLKSLIEVGEPLNIKLEPSKQMLAAIKAEAAKR
jgi:uncharacterized protein YndB with AHSA1/START domain